MKDLFGDEIPDGMIPVRISAKCARLEFNGCQPDYIQNVCHGYCCRAPTRPTGTSITIHPSEEPALVQIGAVVKDNLLQPRPGERHCPFQDPAVGFCGLHGGPLKPFGCIASPFTLNRADTLIVRNRYKLFMCYKAEPRIPAYIAYRGSLDLIFGPDESARICAALDAGSGDLRAYMRPDVYRKLKENDDVKRRNPAPSLAGRRKKSG